MILRIIFDTLGEAYPVTDMFDRFASRTDDPALATAVVIRLAADKWWSVEADEISIITIH